MPIPNGVVWPTPKYFLSKKKHLCSGLCTNRFCGSIELDRKGLDVLIDAVEILIKESAPLFRLIIVGDGPDISLLRILLFRKVCAHSLTS